MKIFSIKNYLPHPTSPWKGEEAKGFGLLEVLISAVIIIMILAALVFIGRAALSNNEYLSERAQAIYLAQEGLELTRQIRDTNWIDGDNTSKWDTLQLTDGNWANTTGTGTKKFVYNDPKARIVLEAVAAPVYEEVTINEVSFRRRINIYSVSAPLLPTASVPALRTYSMKVTSKIEWTFSGQPKEIEVSEILTNWRPDF